MCLSNPVGGQGCAGGSRTDLSPLPGAARPPPTPSFPTGATGTGGIQPPTAASGIPLWQSEVLQIHTITPPSSTSNVLWCPSTCPPPWPGHPNGTAPCWEKPSSPPKAMGRKLGELRPRHPRTRPYVTGSEPSACGRRQITARNSPDNSLSPKSAPGSLPR